MGKGKSAAAAALPEFAAKAEERIARLDRRRRERSTLSGEGIAVFSDGEGYAKIAKVVFRDVSGVGLGVWCGVEIKPGSRFTLKPDSGLKRSHAGVVSRCTRDGDRFILGLVVAQAKAA